jgi:hypothetical protein
LYTPLPCSLRGVGRLAVHSDQKEDEVTCKLTPLGILLAIVLTIPGLLIGGVIAFLYRMFLEPMFGGNLFNWISGGWFETLSMAIIPNAIHGIVGGGLAVWASFKILKRANYEIVAYSVSAIVVAFTAIAFFTGLAQKGMNVGLIELVSNTGGVVLGLFLGREHIKSDQQRYFASATDPSTPAAPG